MVDSQSLDVAILHSESTTLLCQKVTHLNLQYYITGARLALYMSASQQSLATVVSLVSYKYAL